MTLRLQGGTEEDEMTTSDDTEHMIREMNDASRRPEEKMECFSKRPAENTERQLQKFK